MGRQNHNYLAFIGFRDPANADPCSGEDYNDCFGGVKTCYLKRAWATELSEDVVEEIQEQGLKIIEEWGIPDKFLDIHADGRFENPEEFPEIYDGERVEVPYNFVRKSKKGPCTAFPSSIHVPGKNCRLEMGLESIEDLNTTSNPFVSYLPQNIEHEIQGTVLNLLLFHWLNRLEHH